MRGQSVVEQTGADRPDAVEAGFGQVAVQVAVQVAREQARGPAVGGVRAFRVGHQAGGPPWGRNGRGKRESRDRSRELGKSAGPSRCRVAEAGQPLVYLVQAVGREVVARGVRRAEERQVAAGGENGHLVAADGVERVLRGEHHRGPVVAQAAQQAHHLGPLRRVEADRGLLEEELRRLGEQLGCDGGALALAGVQLPDGDGRPPRQIDRAQRIGNPPVADLGAAQRSRVAERTVQREHRMNRVGIGDISDISPSADRTIGRAGYRSRGRRTQSRHGVEQRRLTRSAAADDRHQLAVTNGQRHISQSDFLGRPGLLADRAHLDGRLHADHCPRFPRVSLAGAAPARRY